MRLLAIRLVWRLLALLCLALGFIGIFVPGLPTVPFLLAAAWAAGRGWPALEAWLLNHPRWGTSIRNWREHGAMPRRAKWASSGMMAASALLMGFSGAPLWATLGVAGVMLVVAMWLWRRPES
ncbi:YbaN family protein [Uliginosibacterium flavum]|uniref:YbaN family protein n=1 Tax=Uliginosibacterium flavum TaxID=1396831 RepID=A0ABV2THX6_9RHOO